MTDPNQKPAELDAIAREALALRGALELALHQTNAVLRSVAALQGHYQAALEAETPKRDGPVMFGD